MGFSISKHGLFGTGILGEQQPGQNVIGNTSALGRKSFRNILESETKAGTLDEVTKREILALNDSGQTAQGRAIYNAAKEGLDPKFKARMRTQELFNVAVDRPGAKQLRTGIMFNTGSNTLRA